MKLVPVKPEDIPTTREGRRGRVSYPLVKMFLESGERCSKIDRTGMTQSYQALYSMLNSYTRNHDLPVKVFSAQGDLYLLRLDIDEDGKPIEDWKAANEASEGSKGELRNMAAKPITPQEATSRKGQEKDKQGK